MKLLKMVCPHCGATLSADENATRVVCSYCGTVSAIVREAKALTAEEAEAMGYQFEKGRQKWQKEAEIHENDLPAAALREAKFCPFCGKKIPAAAVICTHCGQQLDQFLEPSNAAPVPSDRPAALPMKSKWTAFFLCLFLGFFGAHKFYEEKYAMGFVYLLTMGLFGIGWFVDLFVLLCRPSHYPA